MLVSANFLILICKRDLKHLKILSFLLSGNNMLYVAVYGPRGPCEGIDIRHQGRNNYNVTYSSREKGEHIIVVKYGEEHVPGSPFKVDCAP